ncbi:membrane protein [Pontibacillus halophilus JSM 076056 = DSM 19796]|uniref:Membrane protein n=1 Tax=Pontibacillus halophilus JSM 076056 = DSM 19796 TaxID=1385510 RepID=A0A0A5GJE2_9BACI|nr:DUF456 domain-containing protein [Pontibacillus halophilus]KGX91338.1 membrane protein [Pontibacillus halophilus JSM 076056 = DSM 19796]
MELLFWVLIVASFIVSYVGLIFPILPSPLFLWGSILLYHFGINSSNLSVWFWITAIVLTLILFVADIIVNSKMVKQYGGSKWGERVAAIGVIIGSFVIPPFGVIILPFLFVFIVEMVQEQDLQQAWRASVGALLGFLGGTLAKFIIQTLIILLFVGAVVFSFI